MKKTLAAIVSVAALLSLAAAAAEQPATRPGPTESGQSISYSSSKSNTAGMRVTNAADEATCTKAGGHVVTGANRARTCSVPETPPAPKPTPSHN